MAWEGVCRRALAIETAGLQVRGLNWRGEESGAKYGSGVPRAGSGTGHDRRRRSGRSGHWVGAAQPAAWPGLLAAICTMPLQ